MKKQLIYFLLSSGLIILTITCTVAQVPDTLWTKTLADGAGYAVFPLEDGGFMVGGYTSVAGYRDFYMAKIDDEGEVIWEKTFGNNDRNESLAAMIKTSDGGYLLAGTRAEDAPYNIYADVYLVKTDAEGNQEWYSIFGEGGESESPGSVAQTLDGGYILCGSFWVNGQTGYDISIIKVNELGAFEWQEYISFENGKAEHGTWIEVASDGGFLITGDTQAFTTNYDYDALILKTTTSGAVEWMTTYGNVWPMYEGSYRLLQSSDGGYFICGYQNDDGVDNNWYVVKTDEAGNQLWNHVIGGAYHEKAFNACETNDGGFAVTGNYHTGNWNSFITKYNADGDTLWTKMWGKTDHTECNYDIHQLDDGGFITVGSSLATGEPSKIYLSRLSAESGTSIGNSVLSFNGEVELSAIQPNPFHSSAVVSLNVKSPRQVEIAVYNLLGAKISTITNQKYLPGSYNLVISGSDLPSGIYYCRLQSEGETDIRKLIRTQ